MENVGFQPFKLAYLTSAVTFFSDLLLYPIDTIATRAKSYKNKDVKFIQEFKHIVKFEGCQSLYRGISTSFTTSFMPQMIYLLFYENLNMIGKQYFTDKKWQNQAYLLPMITAPISELIAISFYIPFDLIRTRLQINSQEYRYKSIFQGLKQIQQQEGLFRLFKASYLYVISAVFYVSIQFQSYETFRFFVIKSQNNKEKLDLSEMLCITVAVQTITTIALNPMDIIITRYQITDESKEKLKAINIIKQIYKIEGFQAFFKKGLTSRLITAIVSGLIWLPAYDYFKSEYGITLN